MDLCVYFRKTLNQRLIVAIKKQERAKSYWKNTIQTQTQTSSSRVKSLDVKNRAASSNTSKQRDKLSKFKRITLEELSERIDGSLPDIKLSKFLRY